MNCFRKLIAGLALVVLVAGVVGNAMPAHSQGDGSAASKTWAFWVAINGKEHGPLDRPRLIEMIRQGKLTKESPIWRDGMETWKKAGTVTLVAILIIEYGPKEKPAPPPKAEFEKFYVLVDRVREGPFDEAGLKELRLKGDLRPKSQVWRRGLEGWSDAEKIPDLQPFLAMKPRTTEPGIRNLVRARARCKATGHEATRDAADFIAARAAAIKACTQAGGKYGCCAADVVELH